MQYELIYYVHSNSNNHSILHLIRVLHWIASQAPNKKYLLMANIDPKALAQHLPFGKEFLFDIIQLHNLRPLTGKEKRERFIGNQVFISALFKNESIHWYDLVIPDRCAYYFHDVDGKDFIPDFFCRYVISKVHLIGSGTSLSNIAADIVDYVKLRDDVLLYGYPYGNLTGRYSPFWIYYCNKIFVAPMYLCCISQILKKKIDLQFEVLSLVKLPTPNHDVSHDIIVDIGLHSPRHDVIYCLRKLLSLFPKCAIYIHTGTEGAFTDFWRKYIASFYLPPLSVGDFTNKLFSAELILSFFPFSAYYFSDFFNIKFNIEVVDFNRRYSLLDDLRFGTTKVIYAPEEIQDTP